jgi:RHS repeat-associated protein
VESRSFTNRGQLASVSLGAPHADAGLVASFTYDAIGRETSRTYGNGLNTTSSYSRADNLITSITVANKPELSFNYSYDSNKNVTAEQRGGSMALYSWNATFDAMDRLNSQNDGVQTRSWSLDLVGNTTSETLDGNAEARTLNDMHAPTAAGNKAYTYDSNGQMIAKPGYTLTWDARNHLVSSVKGTEAAVTYRYDAFGNRVSKGSTRYLLVDNQVVAEFTGSASKQYAYGSYIDEVLAGVAVPSSPFTLQSSLFSFYHRNRQYNTVALTDGAGAIIEQYSTDAMGRVKAFDAAGAAISAPTATTVLFTGRIFDVETGLYYFRARYFEPELGVFVSRDPLGFVDGYAVYRGWFSLHGILDPFGLSEEEVGVGAALSVTWKNGRPQFRFTIGVAGRMECGSGTLQADIGWSLYDFGLGSDSKATAFDVYGHLTYINGNGESSSLPLRLHDSHVVSPLDNSFSDSWHYGTGAIYNNNTGWQPQYTVGARSGDFQWSWNNDGPFHPAIPLTGPTDSGHTGGLIFDQSVAGHDAGFNYLTFGAEAFTSEFSKSQLNKSSVFFSAAGEQYQLRLGVDAGALPQNAVHNVLNKFGNLAGYFDYDHAGEITGELTLNYKFKEQP